MLPADAIDVVLIHQLLGEYGHAIDAADWAWFARLFTADAELDYTAVRAPTVCRGRDQILDYFRDANHPAAHHVTNIVVVPAPAERSVAADAGADADTDAADTAPRTLAVHSKFLAPFTRGSHDPHRWFGGDYHDTVVRGDDGAWRFSRKVCTPRWQFTAAPFDDTSIADHRRTF